MIEIKFILLFVFFFVFTFNEHLVAAKIPPLYLSLKNSPHDFELFANGGFDGNWYVGYNSMWIVELTLPKEPIFQRAFIGAKLGRMKTKTEEEPQGSRIVIPCEIHMSISSTPAWKASDSYFLTGCEDLPIEGVQDQPLSHIGEARWYWREIPLALLKFGEKNYLGIWSSTPELFHAGRSPIIAASRIEGGIPAWLNRGIQGAPPPESEGSLEIPLTNYAPAIAIKLVPEASSDSVHAELISFKEAGDTFFWEIQVRATNIERVRSEISLDGDSWVAFGRSYFDPPFLITIERSRVENEVRKLLPKKKKVDQAFLRVTAWDEWGDSSSTQSVAIYIHP